MGSQSAKDAAKARRREARRTTLTLLNDFDREALKVAAAECGRVFYTQRDQAGRRRHFHSAPHEAPRKEGTPFAPNVGDSQWFRLPAHKLREMGQEALVDVARGVRIGAQGYVIDHESADDLLLNH